MKKVWILFVLLMMTIFLWAEVENPDRPAKGQWNFNLQKEWSIDSVGEDILSEINSIRVADDGNVYFHDGRNKRYYIFDRNGKFIKAFGKEGEGPGEIKWIAQARFFLADDKILIADLDRIHYFSKEGNFIKSVRNNYMSHRPSLFLNQDEFISAPLLKIDTRDKPSSINRYNLKAREDKVITPFPVFKGGVARKGGYVIALVDSAITPMMIIGYDGKYLYYGMNNSYTIHVCDMEGKKQNVFKVDRKQKTISKAEKRRRFTDSQTPKEMLDMIIKSMPDELNYFDGIAIHNGLIYIFVTALDRGNRQEIDIFSPEGKYLYRGVMGVEKGLNMQFAPFIKDGYVYLALEDEEGDVSIAKYKMDLPGR